MMAVPMANLRLPAENFSRNKPGPKNSIFTLAFEACRDQAPSDEQNSLAWQEVKLLRRAFSQELLR
jgi:hypothetical protein